MEETTSQDSLDTLQQQVTQIAQLLVQLQAENRQLRESINLRQQPHMAPLTSKLKLPEAFDGTRSKLRGFLNQVRLIFQLHPHEYPSEEARVGLIGSLLRGSALDWFSPLLEKDAPEMHNHEAFILELESCFGETDKQRIAVSKLRSMTQGSRPASVYAAEFRRVAVDVEWDDLALRDCFRYGLRDDVKDLLLTMEDSDSLAEIIKSAIRCDNRLFERRQERRARDVRFSLPTQVPTPSTTSVEHSDAATPMQVDRSTVRGPLSEAEKRRRMVQRLCLYCGGPNHIARLCPVKRGNRVDQYE